MADTLRLALSVSATQAASLGTSGSILNYQIPTRNIALLNHKVAMFTEIANATGPVNLVVSAGAITREGVAVARTEHGAGRSFTTLNGFIILVEGHDPTIANSGYVLVECEGFSLQTANDELRLYSGIFMLIDETPAADQAAVINLDFTNAVNKRVTVFIVSA